MAYMAIAARLMYFAADRPDIASAVKEIGRRMAELETIVRLATSDDPEFQWKSEVVLTRGCASTPVRPALWRPVRAPLAFGQHAGCPRSGLAQRRRSHSARQKRSFMPSNRAARGRGIG